MQADKYLKAAPYIVEIKMDGDRHMFHYKEGANPQIKVRAALSGPMMKADGAIRRIMVKGEGEGRTERSLAHNMFRC